MFSTCAGVVTINDTRTVPSDQAGTVILDVLRSAGFEEFESRLVRPDLTEIQATLRSLCRSCQLIITIGGTCFEPKHVTPEATLPLLERRADGITAFLRSVWAERDPQSYLYRGVAGLRGQTLIVNLPGSPEALKRSADALVTILPSIFASLKGEGC